MSDRRNDQSRVEAVDRLCDEHDAPGLAEMVLDLTADRDCWQERTIYLLRTDPAEWEPEVIRWLT